MDLIGIIRPGDDHVTFEPLEDDSLAQMQRIVGGLIECVAINRTVDMYVNEEGLIHQLPHNPLAEVILDRESNNPYTPTIVGPAVIVGTLDGETVELPDEFRRRLATYQVRLEGRVVLVPPQA